MATGMGETMDGYSSRCGDDTPLEPLGQVVPIERYRKRAASTLVLWAQGRSRNTAGAVDLGARYTVSEVTTAADFTDLLRARGLVGAVVDLRLRWTDPLLLIATLAETRSLPVIAVADASFLRSRTRLVQRAFAAGATDLVPVHDVEELRSSLEVILRMHAIGAR